MYNVKNVTLSKILVIQLFESKLETISERPREKVDPLKGNNT